MEHLKFSNPGQPVSLEQIRQFEARWNLKLPGDFIWFCMQHGGAAPADENEFFPVDERFGKFHEEYGFPPYDGPPGIGVACFLSIGDRKYSIHDTMERMTHAGTLLEKRVPIGDEGCGNQIMLSVADEDHGAVYYWDHELNDDFKIADSFTEFLDGLTIAPKDPTD